MVVVNFFILTACVTTDSGSLLENGAEVRQVQPVAQEENPAQSKETEISPEVLFQLLAAEIAGQRQQYGLALEGYLRASRQVKDVGVIRRAANIALYVQDKDKLNQALALWLEAEPESLDLRYLMAIVALESGDQRGAVESLDFVLSRGAQDFDGKAIAMIKNLKKQQSLELAYRVFGELTIKYSDNAQLYFIRALLDVQAKKKKQAQVNIAKALELDPDWVKALLMQAQLYIAAGKLPEATDVLMRAIEVQDNAQIREQIVQLLIQQGRFEEAQDAVQELIVDHPENHELKFKSALIYLQTGENKKARNILQTLVMEKTFQDKAAFYLGRMDAKEKRFDDALIWFDTIGSGPFKFDASLSAILIRMDLKRFDLALNKIQTLKKDYPEKKTDLLLLEAELYGQKGLTQKGFDILTSALLEAPDNARVLYARALMAEKLGKLQVLEDDLKYIIEQNPNDANALNALGYTLVDKTTRYPEAKAYLDRAIALKPSEPIILDSYGWLLFKLKRLDESKAYLQRAYKKEPQAEIAAHLVEVLWALQKNEQAKAILSEALAKNPDDKLLLEVQLRLLGGN